MHHHTGMNIARHDHHKLFSLVTAESRNKPYSLKIQCYIVGEIVSNFQAITNKCTAIIKQNTTYRTIIKLGKIKERLDLRANFLMPPITGFYFLLILTDSH